MNSAREKTQGPFDLGIFAYLFEEAEDLRCVVKDREHRYLYVNRGWLTAVGFASADEVVGKTAMDLFPAWRAERYMREEREIMEAGAFLDYEEVATNPAGKKERWRSLNAPWIEDGRIVGITKLGVLLESGPDRDRRADAMPQLVEWMSRHACEAHSIEEIAHRNKISRRSLERHFHEMTGQSPAHYRTHCRIERAKAMLRESDTPITKVATKCGFADQSHLTRIFHKEVGVTPGEVAHGVVRAVPVPGSVRQFRKRLRN